MMGEQYHTSSWFSNCQKCWLKTLYFCLRAILQYLWVQRGLSSALLHPNGRSSSFWNNLARQLYKHRWIAPLGYTRWMTLRLTTTTAYGCKAVANTLCDLCQLIGSCNLYCAVGSEWTSVPDSSWDVILSHTGWFMRSGDTLLVKSTKEDRTGAGPGTLRSRVTYGWQKI